MFTLFPFVGAGLPSPYELPCVQIIMGFTIKDRWKVLGGVDLQSFRCQFSNGTFQNIGDFGFIVMSSPTTRKDVGFRQRLAFHEAHKQRFISYTIHSHLCQFFDFARGAIQLTIFVNFRGSIATKRSLLHGRISELGLKIRPMMGFSMVITKTDKEAALGDTEEVDIVLKTRILPSGKHPTRNARNFEANVKLTSGSIADTIMSNSRQKLEVNSEQAGRLSIQVPTVAAEDCPDLPVQDAEGKYLGASAYIQTDAPAIRAKTEEILDGEINSWRAAEKLCQWVHTAITEKKISGGFGSSLTALESLSGDCTEHTVLFIALARAAGIPARICSGIAFAQQDAFYYHFWAGVYVGRWVQMDPTWGQTIADANHIQLDGSTLESDTLLEFAEDILQTLNQLEIAIVE